MVDAALIAGALLPLTKEECHLESGGVEENVGKSKVNSEGDGGKAMSMEVWRMSQEESRINTQERCKKGIEKGEVLIFFGE